MKRDERLEKAAEQLTDIIEKHLGPFLRRNAKLDLRPFNGSSLRSVLAPSPQRLHKLRCPVVQSVGPHSPDKFFSVPIIRSLRIPVKISSRFRLVSRSTGRRPRPVSLRITSSKSLFRFSSM